MKWLVLLFFAFQCAVAFREGILLMTRLIGCRSCKKQMLIADRDAATGRVVFKDEVMVSVKLPTPNRNIVESFIKSTEFITENVWDKLKLAKVSDDTYLLQLSTIPVPGFSIINPEVEAKLTHRNGAAYVNFDKWLFKDGCGNILKDATFVSGLQIQLSGQVRIDTGSSTELSESTYIRTSSKKKSTVGGKPLYLMCSVEYNVIANRPTTLLDSADVEKKTINLVQSRVRDFMQVRLPVKLVKAFKAFGAKLQQSTEYWL